jgi:hypothetical protein
MTFHRMRLPVGEIAVSSGMADSRWVPWMVICTVTRSPSARIEWVYLCASHAGGYGAPDLLPAIAPMGAGGMVRHVRADQMIEAVVVLGVEVFTRGFDDGTRVLRRNAHPMPLLGGICKAVRTENGMEGRHACTCSAHPIRWRRSAHSGRLARLRVLSCSRTA